MLDQLIDVLKTEYVQTLGKVKRAEDQANMYVNYILIFSGALAAFLALQKNADNVVDKVVTASIVAVGCIVIGLLIIMMAHYAVQSYRIGGYLKYLEEKINIQLEHTVLKWETCISSKYIHKAVPSIFLYVIVAIVIIVLMSLSVWVTIAYIWQSNPVGCVIILLTVLLEFITLFIYAVLACISHRRFYNLFSMSKESAKDKEPQKI